MSSPIENVPDGQAVKILYTNYRGETAIRSITPIRLWHGATEWHPEPQWLLEAFDHEKGAPRSFAMKEVHKWDV